jgi:hypothetical protein
MSSFGMTFKAMFARKRHGVWQVLWVTLLASVVSLIIAMIKSAARGHFYEEMLSNGELSPFSSICLLLGTCVLIWGMLGIIAYFFISVRQNEKINRSATWRLIPISTAKFYGSNLLSAFLSYIILGLIYSVIGTLLLLPVLLDKRNISETTRSIQKLFSAEVLSKIDPWSILGGIVFMLVFGLLVYTGISLINLGSRTLADYLPTNMAKLGRFVIGVIFIILAFWLMNIFNDAYNRWIMIMLEGNTELWVDNLILLMQCSSASTRGSCATLWKQNKGTMLSYEGILI